MAPAVLFNCHFKKVGSKSFSFSLQMFGWRIDNSQKMRNHWCYLSAQGGKNSLFETRCSGQCWLRERSTNRFTYKPWGVKKYPWSHLALKMTSARVVETSVTNTDNIFSQDYTHLHDPTTLLHVTPGVQTIYCSTLEVKKNLQTNHTQWSEHRDGFRDIRLLPCAGFVS